MSVSPQGGQAVGKFDLCVKSYPNPCPVSDECSNPRDVNGGHVLNGKACLYSECNNGANVVGSGTISTCGKIQGPRVWYTVDLVFNI